MYTKRSKKGFTITELIIVIVVIAILAAVLIPTFASLINKANMSADEQVVRQMNTILAAEGVTDKPSNVADAKAILTENGISDFDPTFANNTYYWVGSENRVLLWTEEEVDEGEEPVGAVSYPKESVKKYKDLTEPSVDWSDLSLDYEFSMVEPEEGQTVEEAFLSAVDASGTDADVFLALPKNTTLNLTAEQNRALSHALESDAGVGKHIDLDMNGSTINVVDTYGIDIPSNAALELSNGTFNHKNAAYDDSTFQVEAGASLVLRDMKMNIVAHTAIAPLENASEVIIDDSVINIDSYFGISTNGLTSNAVHILINNSTINNTVDGGGVGICVNCTANVHIKNSKIIGGAHALVMRAGHAEVINTQLETTRTVAGDFKYDSFTWQYKNPKHNDEYIDGAPKTYVWFDGNGFPGAVLVAGDYARETESYPGDVDVSLKNVTFKSANTSEIPHCLVAAKMFKKVVLNYDANTNLGEPILYNYMIPQYFGTITVNGQNKTLD